MDKFEVSNNMLKVFILVVTLILLFTTPDLVVAKSSKIRSYKILEGDDLLVICNVTNSSDIEVYWTKNDTKSTFKQEGKRLEILNIKRSYSGDYICHALNTSFPVPEYNETDVNVTVNVVNVDVQYPAEIDYFSISPYELIENETFTITFDFQANPNPIWSMRNRDTGSGMMSATLPASGTLTSWPTRCEDSGYWECTGHNALSYGVNVTRGHNITVYCSPKPQFGKNQYTVFAKVGNYTELVMYLQTNPRANYTWSKDDGTDISKVTMQENFVNETRLTFPMMSVPYFGNYTLKMQNKYGTYFARYHIVADGAPEDPKNLFFSDVTYDSVKLEWTSGFDMGSRQQFIVVELTERNTFYRYSDSVYDTSTNHGINQKWTYVYTGLESDTRYNVSIVSRNDRGFMSSFAKPSVVFRTNKNPNIIDSYKTNVGLIVGIASGTIGMIGTLAFIVYIVKYRRLRTSYTVINEKPRKI